MPEFEAQNISVFALSYDEPEALKDFSNEYDIQYTLLSDPKSEVIKQYGILNTLINEDDHPWYGIPFPGTYITNSTGTITHKFFENNLAVRVGPEQLLSAIRGEDSVEPIIKAPSNNEVLTPEIFLDGEHLAVSVLRDLVVRFDLPPGRHLYAEPAPKGMRAVDVKINESQNLVTRKLIRPQSEAHRMKSTNEEFLVHNSRVELRLPLTVSGLVVDSNGETKNELLPQHVSGTVSWQICDDEVCDIPQSMDFSLQIPVSKAVVPQIGRKPKDGKNSDTKHFEKMVNRHKSG